MATKYFVGGVQLKLDPAESFKGGEAVVYKVSPGTVAKIYKEPGHPDFEGLASEQETAKKRLKLQQTKLPAFPKGLPKRVISPVDLVTDSVGSKILGYTMPFLEGARVLRQYSDPDFRLAGVSQNEVLEIFRDLHPTFSGIHAKGVVIGDCNDLNILVRGKEGYVIDADSFQYGTFPSLAFTERFVDPLVVRTRTAAEKVEAKGMGSLVQCGAHNADSDWFAFTVMVMQSFLFVHPYAGVLCAKEASRKVKEGERALHGITAFDSDVRYPKTGIPYDRLPDDLVQHFINVFRNGQRGEFPFAHLDRMRWTTCSQCGVEHARGKCPECSQPSPAAVKMQVRGNVTSHKIARFQGPIVHSTVSSSGKLLWLVHEAGQFKREDGTLVTKGDLSPVFRYRIRGQETLLGIKNQVLVFSPGKQPEQFLVDTYQDLPLFDVNEDHRYWVANGQLVRGGEFGSSFHIGDVLAGQSIFRVGPSFGFGFYRAGNYNVSFTFDAQTSGLYDSVKLPPITGQILGSTCYFTKERCWFFVTFQQGGQTINRCAVILRNGTVEAIEETLEGDPSWLGSISGKCVARNFLMAATDNGIMRVDVRGDRIVETNVFPDTEPFVKTSSTLHLSPRGVYVVGRKEIQELEIK